MKEDPEFIGVCKDCSVEFYQGYEYRILPSKEMVCIPCYDVGNYTDFMKDRYDKKRHSN